MLTPLLQKGAEALAANEGHRCGCDFCLASGHGAVGLPAAPCQDHRAGPADQDTSLGFRAYPAVASVTPDSELVSAAELRLTGLLGCCADGRATSGQGRADPWKDQTLVSGAD